MPKGKKRKPQNKGSTKKPKRAKRGFAVKGGDRRKIDTINKKLSEFYNIFGEYSPQYQELKKVVLTQLGIFKPESSSFDDFFTSRSPLRLSTDSRFIELLLISKLDELHNYFKGKTVLREARKIEGFKDLRTKKQLEERKSQIKYDTTVKGLQNIKDLELKELISYLPQFYTALDQMDTSTSEEFTKRFSEYGVIKKSQEPDKKKSEGERLINDILKYFDSKVNEGNLIKNARRVLQTKEPSIYEQLAKHQPVKLKFADDDDSDDGDVDWSNVKI